MRGAWAFRLAEGVTFLGYVVGSYSLARIVAFFPLGSWSDQRPMREVYVFSCLVGIAGNMCYGTVRRLAPRPAPFSPYLARTGWQGWRGLWASR
jgi:MFS family permease